jgi:5-methylcytosine-specific restriction enzyme subunit McrC
VSSRICVHEFDKVGPHGAPTEAQVPPAVFDWLEAQALQLAAEPGASWVTVAQRRGQRVVQFRNHVGVVRAPNGFQIEVLPKIGRVGDPAAVRRVLLEMLTCLRDFRHLRAGSAQVAASRMPLLDIFIGEFLEAVWHVVGRGLCGDYLRREDNLSVLRGKLVMSTHLRLNRHRADRFFTAWDEFSTNRPENRLIHAALQRVLPACASPQHQRTARELRFAFGDVPASTQIDADWRQVRTDRGMSHYEDALAWARLILAERSPLVGDGAHHAPSLLFPMEALFEAFVGKHLARQIAAPRTLAAQTRGKCLVAHERRKWFRLQPDFLVRHAERPVVVLDAKWKLLDASRGNGTDKYGLAHDDFYQLHAYGQTWLEGRGDLVLVYPKTDAFTAPLPVFTFPKSNGLRLWVLPFCLSSRQLLLPPDDTFAQHFKPPYSNPSRKMNSLPYSTSTAPSSTSAPSS